MGILDRIIKQFTRSANIVSPAGQVTTMQPKTIRQGGNFLDMIMSYNNDPLQVAAVYRCINLLSDSVANLPLQYLRKKNDIFVEDTESRLHYLLNTQPNENMSAFDFWKQAVIYMLTDGNAYIVPVYNSVTLETEKLVLCSRGSVSHDITTDTYTINDFNNGISGVYDESEIIHLKNFTRDGKTGLGTLAFARTYINIGSAAASETYDRFTHGGTVRGIVGNDKSVRGFGEYQDKELEKTATDIDKRFRQGERIVSLPGVVDFKQISLSSADLQFLETVKLNVRDICRLFGVHPSFVFDDTSNNYKSADMANVAFLSNTLNPLLRRIENELLRKLVAPSLCCKRKFQFDRRGLYAADMEGKAKYYNQMLAAGIYTVNELRKEENKPGVPDGDKVLVSANLKPITN